MTKRRRYAVRALLAPVVGIGLFSARNAHAIMAYEDAITMGQWCVAAADHTNGSPLQLLACTGNDDQAWAFTPDNLIVNSETGACIGSSGPLPGNNVLLVQQACDATSSTQRWFYDQGSHTIRTATEALATAIHALPYAPKVRSVFSAANGGVFGGNYVVASDYHGGVDQAFSVGKSTGAGMLGTHGFYATTDDGNANEGEIVVIKPVADTWGATPVEPTDSGAHAQTPHSVWMRTRSGLLVNSSSGKCLSTRDGSLVNGAPFILFTCRGSVDQYWGHGVGDTWFNSAFGTRTVFDGTQKWPVISLANGGVFKFGTWLIAVENSGSEDQRGWFLY